MISASKSIVRLRADSVYDMLTCGAMISDDMDNYAWWRLDVRLLSIQSVRQPLLDRLAVVCRGTDGQS